MSSETDLTSDHARRVLGSILKHLENNMQVDETEEIRRLQQAQINAEAAERQKLEERHGQVWDTDQLCDDFEVLQFASPLVVVRRRSDGKLGSLMFQHSPRFYFSWQPD